MQIIRPIELFLLQVLLYGLLWAWNSYIAMLLSVTFATIALFILLISLIAELLERSKVPRAYFWSMLVSVIAPILTAAIFVLFLGVEVGFSDF